MDQMYYYHARTDKMKEKAEKKNPNNFKSWILMVHGKKWKRSCINRVCVMFWLWFHLGIVIQPFLYYIYSILKNFNLIFYVWNLLIFSNMFVHEKKIPRCKINISMWNALPFDFLFWFPLFTLKFDRITNSVSQLQICKNSHEPTEV